MISKEVTGNAISMFLRGEGHFIHGCNNYCNMGNGIAKEVKRRIPGAFAADCKTQKGLLTKLGTFSHYVDDNNLCVAFNAYTQHDFWSAGVRADYKAIELCFSRVVEYLKHLNFAYRALGSDDEPKPLITPLIGAGLAKGDWERIRAIIDEATGDYPVIVVHYDGKAE